MIYWRLRRVRPSWESFRNLKVHAPVCEVKCIPKLILSPFPFPFGLEKFRFFHWIQMHNQRNIQRSDLGIDLLRQLCKQEGTNQTFDQVLSLEEVLTIPYVEHPRDWHLILLQLTLRLIHHTFTCLKPLDICFEKSIYQTTKLVVNGHLSLFISCRLRVETLYVEFRQALLHAKNVRFPVDKWGVYRSVFIRTSQGRRRLLLHVLLFTLEA